MNWEEVPRLTMVLDLPGQYHSKLPNCFWYWCYFLFISFCSVSVTLWTEPLFVFFLIEEEKRKLCLNRVKPLKAPQPNLLDSSILFFHVKLAFLVSASVYWWTNGHNWARYTKRTAITPGFETYSSNLQRTLSKTLTRFEFAKGDATTTATVTKTSLKKWIRAASNFIGLIPSRSVRQMLANFSRVEF